MKRDPIDLCQITVGDFASMSEQDQLKVYTEIYKKLFFDEVKEQSIQAVDVLERLGINDYDAGTARPEVALGFLRSGSQVLKQAFTDQHRVELQVMRGETQFGAALAEAIYDKASELCGQVEDLIYLQMFYAAVMQHRKNNIHMLDAVGSTAPYSAEEIRTREQHQQRQKQQWRQHIARERAKLERVYWGEADPDPLEEPGSEVQLIVPLWSAGYDPMEAEPQAEAAD